MIRAVYYARVSTNEEKQQQALEKQIQDLNNFIAKNDNMILVDEYVDSGKSGTTTKNREEYNRLYNDLLLDKFDIVLVTVQDRLMRQPKDWYLFLDRMLKNKKKLFYVIDNKFESTDNQLESGVKAIMSAEYSRQLSEKINNAHKRRQKQGKPLINSRMWGFDVLENGDIVINEKEAEVIKLIFKLYIEGKGFRAIKKELDENKIFNRNGKDFSLTTLKRIIKNEKYKGDLYSNKRHKVFETKEIVTVPESQWIKHYDVLPSIVDKETWEKANEILKSRKKVFKNDETARKRIAGYFKGSYLYSGKITCGKCGQTYWHQTYGVKNHSLWQCSTYRKFGKNTERGCDNPHIRTEELDTIVNKIIKDFWTNKDTHIEKVINVLDDVLKKNNYNDTVKKLSDQKYTLKLKIDKLIEMYTEELLSKSEFLIKKEDYDNKMKSLNEQIDLFEEKNKNIINKKKRLEDIKDLLQNKFKDTFDEEIIEYFLKEIVVKENEELDIVLNGDFEYIANKIDGEYSYADVTDSR